MIEKDPRFRPAFEFAKKAHGSQLRESINVPYIEHPMKVAEIIYHVLLENDKQLLDSDEGKSIIEAAFLHDTIEDTDTNYETLLNFFGKRTADLVLELTSDKNIEKGYKDELGWFKGRVEFMSKKMTEMSSTALLLKLADRLHNILDSKLSDQSFMNRYIRETRLIARNISERIVHESKPHQILFERLLAELQ